MSHLNIKQPRAHRARGSRTAANVSHPAPQTGPIPSVPVNKHGSVLSESRAERGAVNRVRHGELTPARSARSGRDRDSRAAASLCGEQASCSRTRSEPLRAGNTHNTRDKGNILTPQEATGTEASCCAGFSWIRRSELQNRTRCVDARDAAAATAAAHCACARRTRTPLLHVGIDGQRLSDNPLRLYY